jgi:hypothetical protein
VHHPDRRLSPLAAASRAAQAFLHNVGSATSQAAGMAGKTLVDLPVARIVAHAWQEPHANWAPAPVTPAAAVSPASTTAVYRLTRTATKSTISNPMVKTATTIWLEVAVRAASTPVAQPAVDAMLDTVADIVIEVAADAGRKATLKTAQATATATRDMATAATGHVQNIVALAEIIPLASAAASFTTRVAITAANGAVARLTADMLLDAANAAMRACGSALSATGADALRTTARDTLKAAVKAAVIEVVKELWKSAEQRSQPVPLAP